MFTVALIGADRAASEGEAPRPRQGPRPRPEYRRTTARERGRGAGLVGLRALAGEGVTLASRTRSHPILNHNDAEEIDTEIRSSMEDLAREVGSTPPVFGYRSGKHGFPSVAILRRLGIRAAFTTERSLNDLRRANSVQLGRINVGGRSMLAVVRARMLSRPRWLPSPGH